MFYELSLKRNTVSESGREKEVSEKYIIEGAELFCEAEVKALGYFNGECNVTAIKQSKIREFINNDADTDNDIYLSCVADVYIDEKSGQEKELKYVVAVFATSVDDATKKTLEYMKQGLNDFVLNSVKKTKFLEVI